MRLSPLLLLAASDAASLRLPPISLAPRDAVTAVCIFACGDVVSQKIEHMAKACVRDGASRTSLAERARRTSSAAALGSFYGGAVIPAVYQLAEGLFPGVSPRNVAAKVAVSCGVLSTFGNWFSLMWRRCVQPSPTPDETLLARLSRNMHCHGVSVHACTWPRR